MLRVESANLAGRSPLDSQANEKKQENDDDINQ